MKMTKKSKEPDYDEDIDQPYGEQEEKETGGIITATINQVF
jgi:hypothetical protein